MESCVQILFYFTNNFPEIDTFLLYKKIKFLWWEILNYFILAADPKIWIFFYWLITLVVEQRLSNLLRLAQLQLAPINFYFFYNIKTTYIYVLNKNFWLGTKVGCPRGISNFFFYRSVQNSFFFIKYNRIMSSKHDFKHRWKFNIFLKNTFFIDLEDIKNYIIINPICRKLLC